MNYESRHFNPLQTNFYYIFHPNESCEHHVTPKNSTPVLLTPTNLICSLTVVFRIINSIYFFKFHRHHPVVPQHHVLPLLKPLPTSSSSNIITSSLNPHLPHLLLSPSSNPALLPLTPPPPPAHTSFTSSNTTSNPNSLLNLNPNPSLDLPPPPLLLSTSPSSQFS